METTPRLSSIPKIAKSKGLLSHRALREYSRPIMSGLMIGADLLALSIAGVLAITLRQALGDDFNNPDFYVRLLPVLGLFLLVYSMQKLYPGIGLTPVEELRRLSTATSAMLLVLVAITFWSQTSLAYSRLVMAFFWLLALVSVPLNRWLVRRFALRLGLWGEPVALIGFGPNGRRILSFLQNHRQYGLAPELVVNGYPARHAGEVGIDCPEIRAETLVAHKDLLAQAGIRTAILVPPEIPQVLNESLLDEHQFGLRRLILISSLGWFGGSAVIPHDLQGILGMEVERNLLNAHEQLLKRLLDWALIALCVPLLTPVIGLIALLIKLDSRGPVFYRQKRVGHDGRALWVWKFRTMVSNADELLADCLQNDQALRAEWGASHKLKVDPRVTRIGGFLRKTSLDELPQLINVVRGEMSLVGPRPIVEDEIQHYASSYCLYTQVRPGLTGLWQISGRSDTSYPYRVSLDEYYVRHWSIWMDLYILVCTLWVVAKHSGAY
jgi:Undecaprenyl-phosphate galactose phosphotransferase WbaP